MRIADSYWVHIQQPVVPLYRLPLFDALNERLHGRLRVSASPEVFDGPPSVSAERSYLDWAHTCRRYLKGRLYWQSDMDPMEASEPGDVMVVSGNPRYLSSLRLLHLARRRQMGVVWWGHGWSPTSQPWAQRVRRWLMRNVDVCLFYTDYEAEQWRARLPNGSIVIGAQNAIDQSTVRRESARWDPERLRDFMEAEGLADKRILLFCGRLRTRPDTGLTLLLEAVARLSRSDPDYAVVVIGDGEDREALQTLSHRLGIDKKVRWLGAHYDEAHNAPWFLSALCFVYPGPIGLSLLHAMGYGLPVITHADRARHNPEIAALRDGWNGLTFKDGDVQDLAARIAQLAHQPDLRATLSGNALATVTSDYSMGNMTNRFCSAIEAAHVKALERVRKTA